jgi:hypothetical protein
MAGRQGDMMKINAEKLFLAIFVLVLSTLAVYFVSPGPDNYVYYNIAKEMVRDPSILWRTDLTGWQSFLALQTNVLAAYPPLEIMFFAGLMAVGLPMFFVTILSIVVIGYFFYKMDGKAIPFLFLSFMFIRETAFNGNDILMVAVTLASFYFLTKKKIKTSALFVGMLPLIKSTGFFVILAWLLYIVITERKNIFTKHYMTAIAIALLILFPWYFRNYLLFNDVYLAVMGVSKEVYARSATFQQTGFQASQPEKALWDSTGYYPLPIDILFYIGVAFFIFNIIKTKQFKLEQLKPYSIFIIIMVSVYFIFQAIGIPFFQIRHEMIIFPFLALEIVRGIPERFLKYAFIICLVAFIFFTFSLPKYAFSQYSDAINPACKQIKSAIDFEPVYVNAFHNWFVIYKCNLNATIQNESKWTIDFENGQLYLTNKTNLTNNITGV